MSGKETTPDLNDTGAYSKPPITDVADRATSQSRDLAAGRL